MTLPSRGRARQLIAAALTTMWVASGAAAQDERPRGTFGLTVAVVTEGRLSAIVRSAKVVAIEQNTPAHRAGIDVGDTIVQVNGQRVAGRRAVDFAALVDGRGLERHVDLVLERADGTINRLTLVAEVGRR